MHNGPRINSQVSTARPSVEAVIAAIAGRREPAVLDSAATAPGRGRFTIVACDPIRSLAWSLADQDPFEGLRSRLKAIPRPPLIPPGSEAVETFPCGWIGYFAYEAGRFVEQLPATTRADIGLPVARWSLYDNAAIHDAETGMWTLVAADLSGLDLGQAADRPIASRFATWAHLLQNSVNKEVTIDRPPPMPDPAHNMTRPNYEQKVGRALEYIRAGDIYQVNLARRETFAAQEPAVATYLRLRRTNPGAYAAFLRWEQAGDEAAILSSSPELFLQMDRDGRILTRPIKGTRPRSDNPATDEAYRRALATSPKDRAELAMIVDLERNDLGRVCEYGSVRVEGEEDPEGEKGSGSFSRNGPQGASQKGSRAPFRSEAWPYILESHPTVHHLVANVTGKLRPGLDAIDLLRACFPGGSITGAPKVRAMEIIDELEPTERSVYTGAIGYVSLSGAMVMNIAIRTLILAGGQMHLYTGGGIVADSQPADEYRETEAKALGMRRALGANERKRPADNGDQP